MLLDLINRKGDKVLKQRKRKNIFEKELNLSGLTLEEKTKKLFPAMYSHLKHTRQEIGTIKAVHLNSARLKKLAIEFKDQGYTNSTVNRKIQPVITAFNLSVKEGRNLKVPYYKKLDESANVRQGFFEPEEFDLMMENLSDPYDDIAEFGYNTGWRKDEIIFLEWSNIDFEDNLIRLNPEQTKNSKPRSLPLVGLIRDIILKRKEKRVFVKTWNKRRNGKRIPEPEHEDRISKFVFHREGFPVWNYDKVWRQARIEAGLPSKLFHDFRRTAARNLTRAGVGESVAMKITGHKTNSMFQRYNIVSETDKENALIASQERLKKMKENKQIQPTKKVVSLK